MTVRDLEDFLGYIGSQIGRLLIVAGMVSTSLIGESVTLGLTPLEHKVLLILSVVGGVMAAISIRPFDRRDSNGNLPPREFTSKKE